MDDMRELILAEIKEAIEAGDEELVEEFGEYSEIEKMTNENVLHVYGMMVGFRG